MINNEIKKDEKSKALESLRALREEIKEQGVTIDKDYRKELEKYFDEKYEV